MPWKNKSTAGAKLPKIGLVTRAGVNGFLFMLVAGSIVVSALMIILAIWDYLGEEVVCKAVATCATLIGCGILFGFANDYFGSKLIRADVSGESE